MARGQAQLLGLELGAQRAVAEALQRGLRSLQLGAVAGPGQQRRPCPGFGRKRGLLGQRLDQSRRCPRRSWRRL